MKYIKKIFNKEHSLKFKIGDLVIPTISLNIKLKNYLEKNYGKVEHVYKSGLCEISYKNISSESIIDLMYKSEAGFHREYKSKTGNSDVSIWLYEEQIRHLTQEDLEKHKINKDIEKYNL